MRKAHIGTGLFVAALGAFALVEGAGLHMFGEHGVPGPGFFPDLAAGALVVLGVLMAVVTLVRRQAPADSGTEEAAEGFDAARALRAGRVWIGFAAAAPLLLVAGFLPAMALLVAYLLLAVERIRPLKAILAAVLIPLVVYAVFAYLLGVELPTGLLLGQA
ncbi:tripartite tricarboxylate transporter TctB family protein [Streptomyces sp. TS71-3]|uniref:tripartite tricarboxylate transporter TctB family protein n=1 Tax=Streptomyces sp. TS71-3 TaxID=2733862 RepID=UPI001B234FCD|nr:tripartite tricarboxylate transporter TctB family protein [Streptomyces sp. TS71-3]GHJ41568.1 hypothetical protein Sm713_71770 [Streptomyces sp. TS71-3]